MENWTQDLFPDLLREALAVGFPPRNPQSVRRDSRRLVSEETAARLAVHDETMRNVRLHAEVAAQATEWLDRTRKKLSAL